MSNLIKGFTVALDEDLSSGEGELVRAAILRLKGVAACEASPADGNDFMNRARYRIELGNAVLDFIFPERTK